MSANKRPLSPHLQVYNPQITSVMSILHRMTGVVLALGSLGLLWVLVGLSMGPEAFSATKSCLEGVLGRLAVFAFSLCLMYHLFNGVRHLFWDIGKGYDLATVTRSGLLVLALTVLSTTGLWVLATSNGGAL
ncbi:MAG TPA: succinate dehydrogenase, cytochrome b556 subunit [Arenimonas sp.]|nr:succinate dehydrogenase, cytochrome b556 subunit [Arenimonas sp.]